MSVPSRKNPQKVGTQLALLTVREVDNPKACTVFDTDATRRCDPLLLVLVTRSQRAQLGATRDDLR